MHQQWRTTLIALSTASSDAAIRTTCGISAQAFNPCTIVSLLCLPRSTLKSELRWHNRTTIVVFSLTTILSLMQQAIAIRNLFRGSIQFRSEEPVYFTSDQSSLPSSLSGKMSSRTSYERSGLNWGQPQEFYFVISFISAKTVLGDKQQAIYYLYVQYGILYVIRYIQKNIVERIGETLARILLMISSNQLLYPTVVPHYQTDRLLSNYYGLSFTLGRTALLI